MYVLPAFEEIEVYAAGHAGPVSEDRRCQAGGPVKIFWNTHYSRSISMISTIDHNCNHHSGSGVIAMVWACCERPDDMMADCQSTHIHALCNSFLFSLFPLGFCVRSIISIR